MPTREALYSFGHQYLTIYFKMVNTLLYNLPPPHRPIPLDNDTLNLDSNGDTNLTYTNVFIKKKSYYDPISMLASPPMHTVSPNHNTLISLDLDLDPLSLDPSKSDWRLFLRSNLVLVLLVISKLRWQITTKVTNKHTITLY